MGLESNLVDLQLTGKMINDLFVRARVVQGRGDIKISAGKGGSKALGRLVATIEFETDFTTVGSERIASYIENGSHPRKFLFWTDSEVSDLTRIFEDYVRRGEAEIYTPGNFVKVSF